MDFSAWIEDLCRGLRRTLSATLLIAAVVGPLSGPGLAQAGDERAVGEDFTFFYRQPDILRGVELIKRLNATSLANNAGSQGGVAGFVAALVQRHPASADRFLLDGLDPILSVTVGIGLRLGGSAETAERLAERDRWSSQTMDALRRWPLGWANFAIANPAHLDILWGASFATGDRSYVEKIWSRYREIANDPRVDVGDLVEIVQVRHRRSKTNVRELMNKYDQALQPNLLLAATALWSLESNARRHPFVKEAIETLISGNPEEPASVGFSRARQT